MIHPPSTDNRSRLTHAESLTWIDTTNEPVIALGRHYPAGFRVEKHSHARTQLWSAKRGVALVSTAGGRWMVPPGHGLLIPAGLEHETEMISDVLMHSVYVGASATEPHRLRVLEITPLGGGLIEELVKAYEISQKRKELCMELLLDEIEQLPERSLGLPFPRQPELSRLCRQFLASPSASATVDSWAHALGISRRSFTRLFREETGVPFGTWRQQACIFATLPRLLEGVRVTDVALDAGYENIAAFTTMFRRMLGASPSTYVRSRGVPRL